MMYDKLIRQLRNCAIESAPCKACDMVNDDSCTDGLMKQAADALEELSAVVRVQKAVLEKFPRWIPVSDHLPEQQDEYLVLWKSKNPSWNKRNKHLFYEVLEFDLDVGNWVDDIPQAEPFGGAEVLYWMELPELPKEG